MPFVYDSSSWGADAETQVIGLLLGHRTAPVALRESLASAAAQICQELPSLATAPAECALLVTCHRFELYLAVESGYEEPVLAEVLGLIQSLTGVSRKEVEAAAAVCCNEAATRHLCMVAAGLDSTVLGEMQIQGQVTAAYTQALERGSIGPYLSLLFRTAIRAGKRARTETAIGARATSMSSLALRMIEQKRGGLETARVLVIGAGEMARLALKALAGRNVGRVTVANRTVAHARTAMLDVRWRTAGLEEVADLLKETDVVVSATGARDYILVADTVARSVGADVCAWRQLFLVDLAVPRDIDPSVRGLSHVTLIDVDDLREEVDAALMARRQAVPAAEAIIAEEIVAWQEGTAELAVRPLVVELRRRAERIRQDEVARTLRFLGQTDGATEAHIEHLSRALVNKLLHVPTTRIRELAHHREADQYASAIKRLFDLDADGQISASDANPAV